MFEEYDNVGDTAGVSIMESAGGTSIKSEGGGFLDGVSTFLTSAGSFLQPILQTYAGAKGGSGSAPRPVASGYSGVQSSGAGGGISTTIWVVFGIAGLALVLILTKKPKK